jgi:hypothetical protein
MFDEKMDYYYSKFLQSCNRMRCWLVHETENMERRPMSRGDSNDNEGKMPSEHENVNFLRD